MAHGMEGCLGQIDAKCHSKMLLAHLVSKKSGPSF